MNLCYFLHAYLCLFVTICKFSPHSNGKRPLLYTDSRSHSASIYTTPICHTHHTSRASLPVAAGVFFKCVTLNKTFFVSRIVARLSLIPIALYLILPHGDVFNNRSRHPNSAALRFKWTQQITSSGLCNFWCWMDLAFNAVGPQHHPPSSPRERRTRRHLRGFYKSLLATSSTNPIIV